MAKPSRQTFRRTATATLVSAGLIGAGAIALNARNTGAATPAATTAATSSPSASTQPGVEPAAESAGVRSIRLPQAAINLPEGKGKELVVANCMVCHTPNYIMMQPPLPRKTWEAEVDKMRKTFGAPVPEPLVPSIVDYLCSVRGK